MTNNTLHFFYVLSCVLPGPQNSLVPGGVYRYLSAADAMLLMLVLSAKPVRGGGKFGVPAASEDAVHGGCVRHGKTAHLSINEMISASPILILQNIGNIGTVLALPIALILH